VVPTTSTGKPTNIKMPIAVYNGQHRALSILQMAPFFRSDSSFPNAAYNSLLYCALQVCLFPLPFPRYVNGKFWEENFDGKRKEGVWFQDTESLKEASLNGLLIYAFVCQLPTNCHLALHLTAEYSPRVTCQRSKQLEVIGDYKN
jgi:hypothetical protein